MQQLKTFAEGLSLKKKVTNFAVLSRIFVLLLSCISNNLLPDHKADAFVSPTNPYENQSAFCDKVIDFLFRGLIRWDAQYFLHISRYGYTFENCIAFFPMYPGIVRLVASIFYFPLSMFLCWTSITILSAVSINMYLFVKAAELFYELTEKVLKNHQLAYVASVMFCVNPASIFFSAPYSETLFSFFTFFGMLMCVSEFDILCSVPLGLSAAVRSNGILNILFPLFKISNTLFQFFPRQLKSESRMQKKLDVVGTRSSLIKLILKATASTVITLLPFALFQIYCYHTFCGASTYDIPAFLASFAHEQDLILPGSMYLPWCDHKMTLPYLYVQQHYWNVGFLQYYEFKQIPNFVLAAPVIFLIFTATFCFTKLHVEFNIPFWDLKVESSSDMPLTLFPFIIHAAGLTVFCMLNIHIQVTTRMLASSSPVIYWFAAYVVTGKLQISSDLRKNQDKKGKNHELSDFDEKFKNWWNILFLTIDIPLIKFSKFIKIFFLSYLILGTALFSNFYPWT